MHKVIYLITLSFLIFQGCKINKSQTHHLQVDQKKNLSSKNDPDSLLLEVNSNSTRIDPDSLLLEVSSRSMKDFNNEILVLDFKNDLRADLVYFKMTKNNIILEDITSLTTKSFILSPGIYVFEFLSCLRKEKSSNHNSKQVNVSGLGSFYCNSKNISMTFTCKGEQNSDSDALLASSQDNDQKIRRIALKIHQKLKNYLESKIMLPMEEWEIQLSAMIKMGPDYFIEWVNSPEFDQLIEFFKGSVPIPSDSHQLSSQTIENSSNPKLEPLLTGGVLTTFFAILSVGAFVSHYLDRDTRKKNIDKVAFQKLFEDVKNQNDARMQRQKDRHPLDRTVEDILNHERARALMSQDSKDRLDREFKEKGFEFDFNDSDLTFDSLKEKIKTNSNASNLYFLINNEFKKNHRISDETISKLKESEIVDVTTPGQVIDKTEQLVTEKIKLENLAYDQNLSILLEKELSLDPPQTEISKRFLDYNIKKVERDILFQTDPKNNSINNELEWLEYYLDKTRTAESDSFLDLIEQYIQKPNPTLEQKILEKNKEWLDLIARRSVTMSADIGTAFGIEFEMRNKIKKDDFLNEIKIFQRGYQAAVNGRAIIPAPKPENLTFKVTPNFHSRFVESPKKGVAIGSIFAAAASLSVGLATGLGLAEDYEKWTNLPWDRLIDKETTLEIMDLKKKKTVIQNQINDHFAKLPDKPKK
jgi:hypothetical protein